MMTKEEYNIELQQLKKDYRTKEGLLNRKYADENNPVQIGDIVIDRHQRVRVERIGYYLGGNSSPGCIYYGPKLKKDLTPFKNGSESASYQVNMEHHIRKGQKS